MENMNNLFQRFQISNFIYSLDASIQKKINVMKFVDMSMIFCCKSDKKKNLLCPANAFHTIKCYCIFVKIFHIFGRNYKLFIANKNFHWKICICNLISRNSKTNGKITTFHKLKTGIYISLIEFVHPTIRCKSLLILL